jgi:hypothetical protein
MGIGGSIESVSIAGRTFSVAADADAQIKLGGFENEESPNGDGTSRKLMTRVNWSVTGLALDMDDDNGDLEFLQERADAKRREVFTMTKVSGAIWQGTGGPIGEIQEGTAAATAAVDFGGPGKLTKQ